MTEEQIGVQMRLKGAAQYSAGMDSSTASTAAYGEAAEVAGKKARDANGRFVKMGTGMEKSAKVGTGAFERMNKVFGGFKSKGKEIRGVGKTVSTHLSLPIIAAGAYAVHTAAEFERSMAQVKVAGNVGGNGMESMESLALEMGAKTIFSANESAEAMLELVKSGISPAKIEAGALGSTMSLAATEGLALGRTAEIVGAAMNTFKIKASESEVIADALAGGANASSASVGGLAESLSQGGQSAAMYGLSLEEAVGTLAAFAQNGIQASDAGTSFKTFMMRLNPTQKKQKELMDELNLSFFNSKGEMVGMTQIAKKLTNALAGKNQKEKGAILQTLFGSDAQRAANIVAKEGAKGIGHYIKATEKQGGAQKMANAQMSGTAGSIERLKGSLETAALVAGKAMAPAIQKVASWIEKGANAFSALSPEVQTFIIVGLGIVAMLGPVIYLVGALATAVGFLGSALMFLALNPVGVVITATALAAIAFYELYTRVEWFHNVVDSVVSFLKANPWVMLLMGPMFQLIAVITLVVTHFGWFKNAVKNAISFFQQLPSRVMAALKSLPGLVKANIGRIVAFFLLLPIRIPIMIEQMGVKLVRALIGIAPSAATAAAHIAVSIAKGIASKASQIWEWVKTLPGKFASAVSTIVPQLLSLGGSIASSIAKGLKEELVSILPGPVKDALGAVGGAAGDVGSFLGGAFASGTSFAPGGVAMVGEKGPELVNLPRGSEVLNAARTRRVESHVGPLRHRGGPSPVRAENAPQRGAQGRRRRLPVEVRVPVSIGRRQFGEAMAMAMIEDEENE